MTGKLVHASRSRWQSTMCGPGFILPFIHPLLFCCRTASWTSPTPSAAQNFAKRVECLRRRSKPMVTGSCGDGLDKAGGEQPAVSCCPERCLMWLVNTLLGAELLVSQHRASSITCSALCLQLVASCAGQEHYRLVRSGGEHHPPPLPQCGHQQTAADASCSSKSSCSPALAQGPRYECILWLTYEVGGLAASHRCQLVRTIM